MSTHSTRASTATSLGPDRLHAGLQVEHKMSTTASTRTTRGGPSRATHPARVRDAQPGSGPDALLTGSERRCSSKDVAAPQHLSHPLQLVDYIDGGPQLARGPGHAGGRSSRLRERWWESRPTTVDAIPTPVRRAASMSTPASSASSPAARLSPVSTARTSGPRGSGPANRDAAPAHPTVPAEDRPGRDVSGQGSQSLL